MATATLRLAAVCPSLKRPLTCTRYSLRLEAGDVDVERIGQALAAPVGHLGTL